MKWVLIALGFLLLTRRSAPAGGGSPNYGPMGFGGAMTPGGGFLQAAINPASAGMGTGLTSAALNGFGRPAPSGFGYSSQYPTDPVYGDPGYGQVDLSDPNAAPVDYSGLAGPDPVMSADFSFA